MSDVRLMLGDCLDLLRSVPDASVDAVITDPPYSSGGAFRGDRMQDTTTKYVDGRDILRRPDFGGDNRDQRAYGYWCALWLGECLRVVKPGGICGLFTDWRQLPTTTDALQAGGWVWRGIGVWDKTEAARPAKGRFRNQCEYLVWGSSGSLGTTIGKDDERPCLAGLWRHSVASDEKHHITGKPARLMRSVVEICPPGGVVLDPFMGSGTTGVACLQTGRTFIGIEREPHYFTVAEKRIHEATLQQRMTFEEAA